MFLVYHFSFHAHEPEKSFIPLGPDIVSCKQQRACVSALPDHRSGKFNSKLSILQQAGQVKYYFFTYL